MSPQYQILSELLDALRMSAYCDGRKNGVECLIYRLKLLLLTFERHGHQELSNLCPATALREMQRLVLTTDSFASAGAALTRVEAELNRLIHGMETTRVELEAGCEQAGAVAPTSGNEPARLPRNQPGVS